MFKVCVLWDPDYNFSNISSIWMIFYWTYKHCPSHLYLVGDECQKSFGVESDFMLSYVLEIS